MNDPTNTNPLMQVIEYNGQQYYTSLYFHHIYRKVNAGEKYANLSDFNALIRSIETFDLYIKRADIVELVYDKENSKGDIPLLHKSNSYKPIMLISMTAQVALFHHLDDEVNKHASVNMNAEAAERIAGGGQASTVPAVAVPLRPTQIALEVAKDILSFGELMGTDLPMSKVIAIKHAEAASGLDLQDFQKTISLPDDKVGLTPTALGEIVGVTPVVMNGKLLRAGFQKKIGKTWVPEPKATGHHTMNPYQSQNSEHVGYRIMWYRSVLNLITPE